MFFGSFSIQGVNLFKPLNLKRWTKFDCTIHFVKYSDFKTP